MRSAYNRNVIESLEHWGAGMGELGTVWRPLLICSVASSQFVKVDTMVHATAAPEDAQQ